MKREELLRSKEYWTVNIQNDLFGIIEEYMQKNNFNRTKLAETFGVSKGYITQVMNGDFDHKLSKLVELALASGKVPVLHFVDVNEYVKQDAQDKMYDLVPMMKSKNMTYTKAKQDKKPEVPIAAKRKQNTEKISYAKTDKK